MQSSAHEDPHKGTGRQAATTLTPDVMRFYYLIHSQAHPMVVEISDGDEIGLHSHVAGGPEFPLGSAILLILETEFEVNNAIPHYFGEQG